MGEAIRTTTKLLLVYYLITLHIAVMYFVIEEVAERYAVVPVQNSSDTLGDRIDGNSNISVRSSTTGTPTVQSTQLDRSPDPAGLMIPVAGIRRDQLIDSFSDPRSSERSHDAIDIPAPAGTPVVAAADGQIIKFFESEAGGVTIYQLSADHKFVFYYAHLQSRATDINVGDHVTQGRTIGFVGDTGNAGEGNYHLHFSIMSVPDPKRYWEGVYINPFPLLTR